MAPLRRLLGDYHADGATERADLVRAIALLDDERDPFDRRLPLHLTGSAVVIHAASGRVLLRWHSRQQAWLQVGGHGDPGEDDPFAVAWREAREETGLSDLEPYPLGAGRRILHLVAVPVPSRGDEGAHEHLDVRYLLSTSRPEEAVAETENAPLRWVELSAAIDEVEPNLALTLRRVSRSIASSEEKSL